MKKLFKNKTALLLTAALLFGFAGTIGYLYIIDSKKAETNKEETKNNENTEGENEKGDLPPEEPVAKAPQAAEEKAPSGQTSLAPLNASVTAQKSVTDESISILFYVEGGGTFTVQEKSGGSWQTTKENVSYAGRGGLDAGTLAAGQNSKTLRVLEIENGKYTAATKEFTINRQEVEAALGIKTYN